MSGMGQLLWPAGARQAEQHVLGRRRGPALDPSHDRLKSVVTARDRSRAASVTGADGRPPSRGRLIAWRRRGSLARRRSSDMHQLHAGGLGASQARGGEQIEQREFAIAPAVASVGHA
jgi:hypothetical protein